MRAHHPTPIAAEDRVPLKQKIAYGLGNVGSGIQEQADKALLNPVFVLLVGISPSTLSLLSMLYRVWDGVTDALMGWISDNTRGRWGRRRPYIFAGAILMGLWMPVLFFFNPAWSVPSITWWMFGAMLGLYLFNTLFNIPYQCLLLEITPDSNERTNVVVWRSYLGKIVELIIVWMWWIVQLPFFNNAAGETDILNGARWVTCGLGIAVIVLGLLPALFIRERYYLQAAGQPKQSLWANFRLTLANRPFVILTGFTLLMTIGVNMAWGLDFYTRLYYVCSGDQNLAASLQGTQGTITVFTSLASIPLFQWIARRFGKLSALKLTMWIVLTASASTLACYTPEAPWLSVLPGLLLSPAITAIWVLIPSLTGDIVDHDEVATGQRREGAFASIFSWFLKLAFSLAAVFSGPLVELAGFRTELRHAVPTEVQDNMRLLLAFAPACLLAPAIWLTYRFPLTTKRIEENRQLLEARRGRL